MAVWHLRTGQRRADKPEAIAWMHKVVSYVNSTYPESNYEVLTNIGGDLLSVHAMSRYESLAQYEAFQAKLLGDEQYRVIVQEMMDADFYTSWSDRLFRVRLPT